MFMKQARWTITAVLVGTAFAASASSALAASFKVGAGKDYTSIQAAVDAAGPGDKVIVYPGTYTEPHANLAAVTIDKPLKLLAKPNKSDPVNGLVKIVPGPGQIHGILAEGTESTHIDGLQIKKFTVQGFTNNGIWLRYVDNFTIDGNTSIDNGENGIWPTLSANGLVKKNTSYGSDDSALWVEASTDVRVLQNTIYDSVTGLEVTISANVEMEMNTVYNNTVGVGLYHPNGAGMDIPPGLVHGGWVLNKNTIYDNNRPNTAPPSSLAGALPPGGGVLVLGVDRVEADSNVVTDNDFYGVALVDYCTGVDGGDNDCDLVPAIVQGMPEQNTFRYTEFSNNGTNPDPLNPLSDYAADFTYVTPGIFDPDPEHAGPYKSNRVCGTPLDSYTRAGITFNGAQVTFLPGC
jgi:parallel beta-helix repeat protein